MNQLCKCSSLFPALTKESTNQNECHRTVMFIPEFYLPYSPLIRRVSLYNTQCYSVTVYYVIIFCERQTILALRNKILNPNTLCECTHVHTIVTYALHYAKEILLFLMYLCVNRLWKPRLDTYLFYELSSDATQRLYHKLKNSPIIVPTW